MEPFWAERIHARARACVCDKIRIGTPTHNHNITQGVLVQATEVDLLTETTMSLTITEGKYHQVKRMIAAIGNRCEALRRVAIAGLALPADLDEGDWRYLTPSEVDSLLDR